MGLKEKRAAREFQEHRLDSLLSRAFKAAKFEFEVDVNWDTIAIDDYSHIYDQTWPLIYFEPLIKALKDMCDDEFSQEAIAEDLKKVVIQNFGDIHNPNNFATYSKGVLTLNHSPIYNAENQVEDRKEAIMRVIEKEL